MNLCPAFRAPDGAACSSSCAAAQRRRKARSDSRKRRPKLKKSKMSGFDKLQVATEAFVDLAYAVQ